MFKTQFTASQKNYSTTNIFLNMKTEKDEKIQSEYECSMLGVTGIDGDEVSRFIGITGGTYNSGMSGIANITGIIQGNGVTGITDINDIKLKPSNQK